MKKVFLILFACMIGLSCYAEKKLCVVVHEAQGQTAFDMEQRPAVSFVGTDVKMVCGDMEVLYPLTGSLKITIEEAELETAVSEVMSSSFTISQSAIAMRGCESLSLYTLDGKMLATGKADSQGVATIAIDHLSNGIYIVKTGNKAFKIIKK